MKKILTFVNFILKSSRGKEITENRIKLDIANPPQQNDHISQHCPNLINIKHGLTFELSIKHQNQQVVLINSQTKK